jgi:putative PIN family toxin of toxin-antitoxin system
MRVVLDTNVLVSALISPGGWPDTIYRSWRGGQFVLISSEEQFEEFRRVSRYPRLRRFLQPAAAGAMLNEIRLLAVLASPLPKLDISPDPADNFLLAMAQVGHADYLVTRDKDDLLTLVRHKGTRIVSVHQMIEILE